MKSLGTLNLDTNGAVKHFEREKLIIEKGKMMLGVFAKMTIPLANASGGNITLSDTQKQSFLATPKLTLSYGKAGRRRPYNDITLNKLQRISRVYVGQDWEGYTGSTSGLGQVLTNGATTSCTLWVFIPTSRAWHSAMMRKVFGVGRTQAKTMALEFKRGNSDGLPAGVTISGGITVDIIPLTVSAPFDRWLYLPEYIEIDETSKVAKLPAGLAEYVAEITAAGASTALTDVTAKVDDEVLYEKFNVYSWYTATVLTVPNIPSEADPSDRETILHWHRPEMDWTDLPTGVFSLEQNTKTLPTAQLRALIAPIPTDDEIREDVQECAGARGRNKPLKAVSIGAVLDIPNLKAKHYPYLPFCLFDADDKEFQQYPGMVSTGAERAEPFIPESVKERAMSLIADYLAKGERAMAEDVKRKTALAIPGAVQDVRGFARNGSPVYAQVGASLGQ
jgi:hypothetical protein